METGFTTAADTNKLIILGQLEPDDIEKHCQLLVALNVTFCKQLFMGLLQTKSDFTRQLSAIGNLFNRTRPKQLKFTWIHQDGEMVE